MSWYYNNENQNFIDATQILEGGGSGGASQNELDEINADITQINEDLTELKEVFIPKQLNTENASLDTIIVNNTLNSRIFIKNQNSTPKIRIEGGKLYLYYDFNFTNAPTITAGWIDVDNYITAIKQSVLVLDANVVALDSIILAPTIGLKPRFEIIEPLTISTATQVAQHEARIDVLETDYLDNFDEDKFFAYHRELAQRLDQSLKSTRDLVGQYSENLSQLIQTSANYTNQTRVFEIARLLYNSKTALLVGYLQNILLGLGGVGVIIGTIAQIYDIITSREQESQLLKYLTLYEKIKNEPLANELKIIHLNGLAIIENTNNNYSTSGNYTITLANQAKLSIRVKVINSELKAEIVEIKEEGSIYFNVNDIINIPKSSIGGTTGNLQIQVTSLISEVQMVSGIINKLNGDLDIGRNRRRLRDGIINKNELGDGFTTTYNSSLTNTETGEVLQVPTIKVNLNSSQFETINGAIQTKPLLNNNWNDPIVTTTPATFKAELLSLRTLYEEVWREAVTLIEQGTLGSATARVASRLASKKEDIREAYLDNVLVGLTGYIYQIWDVICNEANVKLEKQILLLHEKLGNNSQNDLPKHIHRNGLQIVDSTNNGVGSIGQFYNVTISNGGIITFVIALVGGVAKAFPYKVKEVGNPIYTEGQILDIPKNMLGGTAGILQIQITTLISEKQVVLDILDNIKLSQDEINNRRRLRDKIINTDELGDGFTTTYDMTLNNPETGEIIQIPKIKIKLNTNQFETISGAIQIKPSFLGKGLEIVADKLLLDLNTTQFDFINNDLNIIGYDTALTNITTIQSDITAIEGNLVNVDAHLINIDKVLLPYGATITDDYKLNLGYKEIFLNYPYDLMMLAIKSDTYTTFTTSLYNNDYLGYFPNMSRLALSGDAKVIYDTQVTANSFGQFTKGFIYIKNTNDSKVFNMNRKFEFVSFLKFVSFNNNTTDYHLIQSGVDLGTQIEIDNTKLSVYIRNRKLIVKHPALVEYQSYQVSTTNFLTTYIVNNSYSEITSTDDDILLRATPVLINNQTEYKYSFDMRNIGFYLLTTYSPNLIKVIDNGYTTEVNNDTTYVAFYLSHPNDPNRPIANCVYPFLDLKIGQQTNGNFFDVSPVFIRRVTLKFDIIYNTTLGQSFPDTKYQYNYAETTERCDFTFRITYSLDGLNFVEHNFSMADVNPTFTTTGTTYDSYFSNPSGQAIFPKRYWTYSFDIVGTYPDTGQKIRNLTFRLIPKPNSPYQYGTTASYLYNFQPILYLFKYIISPYNSTTSPTQVTTTNYLTTNSSTALSSGILNSKFYLMTLQMDLPNNNIGFYVDGNYYNFTERTPVKLYPADTTMPDPSVLFVNATFISWANLTTDNSILVVGNTPSTGSINFTHFNYRYFQNTETFLTLTEVQKLMGLITYNYYYDYVSVDKLLDTNEIFANQLLTKQLVVNNNKLTKTFTTALRTRDLRTNQTQDEGNVLIPIRNLYIENPTASGNLIYNLSTKTFSIGSSGIGTRSEEDEIILGFIEDSAGFALQWDNITKTLNVIPEDLYQDITPIYTEITTTSNILFTDYVARDAVLDTKITTTSNILFTDFVARDALLNTEITTTSNILFTDYVARDAVLNTQITTTSNILFTNYVARDAVLTADYIARDDIMVLDSIERDDNLSASIEANKYTDTKVLNLLGSSTSLVFKELTLAKDATTALSFIKYATGTTNIQAYTQLALLGNQTDIHMFFSDLQYLTFTIVGIIILQIQSAGIVANKTLTITGTNQLNFQTGSVSLPATITGGTGCKIIYYPSTTTFPYSTGVNASTLWHSVPNGARHEFYVNGVRCMRTATTETILSSTAESANCILGLSTPFDASVNKYGCAIIAEAQSNWSRANLCLCVNNVANNTTSASLTSSLRMRMWYYAWTEFYGTFGSPSGLYSFFSVGNTTITYANTSFANICIKVNGSIWVNGGSVAVSSTREIKKEIEELDDQECLNKLLQLKPCKYRYIDNTLNKHPTKKVFGFIAEEVKEVIPEAVDDNLTGVIPNIYENAEVQGDILTMLTTTKTLEINKIYTCYGEENDDKIIIKVLEDLGDGDYKIDKTYDNKTNLFVYGKEIDNYHALKKEYLHALAISAIQEHNKIIMKQKEQITDLTARLERMEAMMGNMLSAT